MKTFLPISPQHEETREIVSGIAKHNYYPEISVFRPKKPWFSTGTVKFNVIWPTKIRYHFVSGKFSEMGAGTNDGTD